MEGKLTIANKDIIDMSKVREIIIHTLYLDHLLVATIDSKSDILNTLCCHIYLWQLLYLCEYWIIAWSSLTLSRDNLYLRIEVGEERSYKVMETIENTKYYHQSHGSNGNTNHRYHRDDINGMCALF